VPHRSPDVGEGSVAAIRHGSRFAAKLRRVQVEHFGDDWPEDLPAWDSIAAEMPPDPRVA